jgi:hypothetical protein
MKKQPVKLRLHGIRREIDGGTFESIAAAKRWIALCWNRPYTLEKLKP